MRPLTPRASSAFLSFIRGAEIIGVLMNRDALMISLIRGTPRVMSDLVKVTKVLYDTENIHKNHDKEC